MGTFAYDAAGSEQWVRRDIALTQPGAALTAHGIAVIDSTGMLHLIDSRGHDEWQVPIGMAHGFGPVVSRDMIYIADGRALTAITPQGKRSWAATAGGPVEAIAAASDGGLYVLTADPLRLEHFTAAGNRDTPVSRDSLIHCAGDSPGPSVSACSRASASFRARLDPLGAMRFLMIPVPLAQRSDVRLVRVSQTNAKGAAFIVDDEALRAIAPDSSDRWRISRAADVSSDEISGPVVTPAGDVTCIVSWWPSPTLRRALYGYDDEGGQRWMANLTSSATYSRPTLGRGGMLYIVNSDWVLTALQSPR
jgi:hypothetical protein